MSLEKTGALEQSGESAEQTSTAVALLSRKEASSASCSNEHENDSDGSNTNRGRSLSPGIEPLADGVKQMGALENGETEKRLYRS